MRILFIGEFPPPEGGVSVSLQHLYNELSKNPEISLIKIDITQARKRRNSSSTTPKILDNSLAFAAYMLDLLRNIRSCDLVALHVVSPKVLSYGAYALIVSKLFNKNLLIRKFGGTDINTYPYLKRTTINCVLRRSDAYLAQTKYLVAAAKKANFLNVHWFPTHRPTSRNKCVQPIRRCERFVYVGQVREEKGICILADALRKIPTENPIVVTIYGSLNGFGITEEYINSTPHMRYGGELKFHEVNEALAKHEVFIFPTFWMGEGYSGALIEALSVGLPVIVSDWHANPEVVTNRCAIMVPVKHVDALHDAIMELHEAPELWPAMHKAALERGEFFSVTKWAREFVEICRHIKNDS